MKVVVLVCLVLAGCSLPAAPLYFPRHLSPEFDAAVNADVDAIVAGMEAYARNLRQAGRPRPAPMYAGGLDRA